MQLIVCRSKTAILVKFFFNTCSIQCVRFITCTTYLLYLQLVCSVLEWLVHRDGRGGIVDSQLVFDICQVLSIPKLAFLLNSRICRDFAHLTIQSTVFVVKCWLSGFHFVSIVDLLHPESYYCNTYSCILWDVDLTMQLAVFWVKCWLSVLHFLALLTCLMLKRVISIIFCTPHQQFLGLNVDFPLFILLELLICFILRVISVIPIGGYYEKLILDLCSAWIFSSVPDHHLCISVSNRSCRFSYRRCGNNAE